MNNNDILKLRAETVEKRLSQLLECGGTAQDRLVEAMRYSLLAGGKRIRPVLTLEFCRACGAEPVQALDFGCAIEMLHTYSLIHDDMPCMDNDDLRRGKPTCHKVYGEWLAMLAGDALQAQAFSTLAECGLGAHERAEASRVLAYAAGYRGICGGQYLDLSGEGHKLDAERVYLTHSMKTAALIEAACELGCIAAGAYAQRRSAAVEYGRALGMAFQIRDDVLDCEGTEQSLGKSTGKDAKSEKFTFVTRYGIEKCRSLIEEITDAAISCVQDAFDDAEFLVWLARMLAGREK